MIDEIDIPGYDLKEFIAKGGMSSVYRARQHIFERDIALKIMRQDLSEEDSFIERFMQESLIVAKLHHSHIVQVYDVGEVSNHCFIAMEFLSGGVLKTKMANGLPIKKSVSILKQIASALDFAHQKGIVHRDIKPDNIMFREDGAAVLTDFGIAKDRTADMELTQTGAIMGTPKYMAPEQIKGEVIEPATDLYSLGIVFYEMLTGFVPFQGSDFVSIAHKHLTAPVPLLSGNLTCFQFIIDKLLAKEPSQRFSRAGEIYLALDDVAERIANPEVENTVVLNANSSHFTAGTYDSLSGRVREGNAPDTLDSDVAPTNIYTPPVNRTKKSNTLLFIVSAACLVAIVLGGVVWQLSKPGNTAEINAANAVPLNNTVENEADQETNQLIATLLADAQIDVNNNRLTIPEDRNALDKYRRVLALDQNNKLAREGIDEIARLFTRRGIAQVQLGNVDDAKNFLLQAQSISPNIDEISQLEVALNQKVIEANNTKKNILSMRDEIRIDGLLGMAENNVKEGKINSPPGNNAIEKYQQVLSIDPNNKIAIEKLAELNRASL